MFYKEWINVRYKIILWVMVYASIGILLFVGPGEGIRHGVDWRDWIRVNLFVTIFAPILGGVDTVADEVDRNTLGFLISRPISRFHIYNSKLLINFLAWAGVYLFFSVVVFLGSSGYLPSLEQGIAYTLLGLALGATVICVSSCISVFTRTAIQALLVSLPLLAAIPTTIVMLNQNNDPNMLIPITNVSAALTLGMIPIGVGIVAYALGGFGFRRREF